MWEEWVPKERKWYLSGRLPIWEVMEPGLLPKSALTPESIPSVTKQHNFLIKVKVNILLGETTNPVAHFVFKKNGMTNG